MLMSLLIVDEKETFAIVLIITITLALLAKKKLLKKCTIIAFIIGLIQWLINGFCDVITISVFMAFFGIIWEANINSLK